MQRYVLGFAYHKEQVLLVQKPKGSMHEGLWNGIGGKLEVTGKPGEETALEAMNREWAEETALAPQTWSCVGLLSFQQSPEAHTFAMVYLFHAELAADADTLAASPDTAWHNIGITPVVRSGWQKVMDYGAPHAAWLMLAVKEAYRRGIRLDVMVAQP